MSERSRLEDLRRRVQQDPASIAFAQLAEELRRENSLDEAVSVCRAGLAVHPGYVSARLTLGRALLELGELDAAEQELARVVQAAPDNLAAIRALGDVHARRGSLSSSLTQFQTALSLAPNDPALERTVNDLSRQLSEAPPIESTDHRLLAALEGWLHAIHATRAERRP
jgi:predicted Zn-dependent protease